MSKRITTILTILLASLNIIAKQNIIYSKAYGERKNPPVIFIHGGPRGNATLFEGTTAQKLADRGFYVIVYDRRGEGRSIDTSAKFTYQEAIKDLKELYKSYKLKKANIIAHSFGGLVGTLFTSENPEKVNALILVGALFSQQETYSHILETTKNTYRIKNDSTMLSKISEIEKLIKSSAEYRKKCYEIASLNNYFKMPYPTVESKKIQQDYDSSIFSKNNIRNDDAPILFYKNEHRNNIDTKPILKKLSKQVKLFAIYGEQDGIFSIKQISDVQKIVGSSNFMLIANCSHYPFVDQQQKFLTSIENWLKTN